MAKEEIATKLKDFLKTHSVLSEECQAVYLMVEIRKIIDQTKSSLQYPHLKFYSDWTVHSEKDSITSEIRKISEEMYAYAVNEINALHPGMLESKSPVLEFAYMSGMCEEMKSFFAEFGLNSDLPINKEKWTTFVSLLVKVLENQLINNPSINVQTIIFDPANPRCVILRIIFKVPVKDNLWFRLMNVYWEFILRNRSQTL